MSEMQRQDGKFRLINATQLLRLKTRAMRSGVWFRALQRIDRVLVDLTIKVTSDIRSITLTNSLLAITRKLHDILENKLAQAIREIGYPAARKLSSIAQNWGNKQAKDWVNDKSFIWYLTIMKLNRYPLIAAEHEVM